MSNAPPRPRLISLLRAAFRANLAPALLLWSALALLLAGYFFVAPIHQSLNALADVKKALGLGFSMPAQALAGGLLPFLFQSLQKGAHRKTRLAHVPFLMLFWACQGAVTDRFYAFQALVFGDNAQLSTILFKTAVDMLIFSPFVAIPLVVFIFAFKDAGFSPARTVRQLGPRPYRNRVLPVYVAAVLVWAPSVALLYSLPLALQFPVQALVQCLWGLILVVMTARD